jgi:ABC-type nitrate/sulfonate/bicarbonate transport system substrate-binding protein
LLGEARGFNTLVRGHDVLGRYLGIVAGVRKSWAESNRDLLVRIIRAYARGLEPMYERRELRRHTGGNGDENRLDDGPVLGRRPDRLLQEAGMSCVLLDPGRLQIAGIVVLRRVD